MKSNHKSEGKNEINLQNLPSKYGSSFYKNQDIFVQQRMRQIERNIVDLERSITSERTKINSRFGKDKILL